MADKKTYSPREVALALLAKSQELLAKTGLGKTAEPAAKVAEHQSGMHTVGYYSTTPFEKSESLDCGFEPFQKSEKNPDEKADAKLGEEVEGLCESHMVANKDAERKEGHKIVKSESCTVCKSEFKKAELNDLYEVLGKIEALEKAENKDAPSNPMKPKIEEEQAPQRDAANFEPQAGHSETPADHRQAPQAAPEANPAEQKEGNNPPAGSVPGKGVHKLSFFMGHRHHKKNGMKKGIALS